MARLLVTGGTGFVGYNLVTFFEYQNSVMFTSRHEPIDHYRRAKWRHMDVRDWECTREVILRFQPECVIHCAGIRDLKFCEEHPDKADYTNAKGTGNVARACARIGAKLIYLSTDVVFSSTKGHYYEYDIPHSSLAYGRSKYRGETLAIQEMENVAICRSAGVYGKGSPLLHWFAGEIEKGKDVECFLDVFSTPTFAFNLGEMLKQIIDRDLTGIFHTVGKQRVNRYDFFSSFASAFSLDTDKIKPVNAGDRRRKLMLMPDSSLSSKYTIERLEINADSPAEGFLRLKVAGGF